MEAAGGMGSPEALAAAVVGGMGGVVAGWEPRDVKLTPCGPSVG